MPVKASAERPSLAFAGYCTDVGSRLATIKGIGPEDQLIRQKQDVGIDTGETGQSRFLGSAHLLQQTSHTGAGDWVANRSRREGL
jgi:hypothetical protein